MILDNLVIVAEFLLNTYHITQNADPEEKLAKRQLLVILVQIYDIELCLGLMNVPITPGTLLQDRYFVLRVLRPIEFGWMYRAVDQRNHGTVCLLEEFIIPDRVADRSAILQQKFTLEMQRFEHWQGLPGFVETIVDQNRVFMVQSWGDHASYDQVLEDRVLSGEGAAELEVVEAVELLDGLEPLLRSLSSAGLTHGYVCRNTIVWLDHEHCPGLMHFGQIRSIALQYEIDAVNAITPINDGQSDLQQLAAAVLDLLGNQPWNRIDIQLAHRLRLLLEPENRSQLRSTLGSALGPQMISQTSASSSQKLPAYASFATQASIPQPSRSLSPLESQPPSHSSQPFIPDPSSSQSHNPGPLPRRRVKRRSPKHSSIRLLTSLIAHWIHTVKNDPSLGLMAVITIGLCGILGHRLIATHFPTPRPTPIVESSGFKLPASNESPTSGTSPIEATLSADFENKLRTLNIPSDWFSATVTDLAGDAIGPADSRWKDRATLLLNALEALPPEARQDIGTYRRANLDTWLRNAQPTQKLEMISKQVEDATDVEFFKAFPDRKGTALNPRNLGQVWYAIARTETAKLKR